MGRHPSGNQQPELDREEGASDERLVLRLARDALRSDPPVVRFVYRPPALTACKETSIWLG